MATEKRIQVPDGVNAEVQGSTLVISGPKGTLKRNLHYPGIALKVEDCEFIVSTESTRKKIYAMLGTFVAHAGNMCKGVQEEYVYRLKVIYNHFPIQLKQNKDMLEIVNFLGEKEARYAAIPEGVSMKISGDEITLSGIDKELVGISASRIEKATKVRGRDTRVFQDGIYIVEKA